MFAKHRQGSLEVICGPMFSGKSEELIRRVKRAVIARQKVQVFKPRIDDRYHFGDVVAHDGESFPGVPVDAPVKISVPGPPTSMRSAPDEFPVIVSAASSCATSKRAESLTVKLRFVDTLSPT